MDLPEVSLKLNKDSDKAISFHLFIHSMVKGVVKINN